MKGKVVVGNNSVLRSQIIFMFHNSALEGHSGMTVTSKTVGSLFYWKGQQKHIRQHVREYNVCQRTKHEIVVSPGLIQPLPIPITLFIDFSMDFVEGLPKSDGKDVIMVIVDRFSKDAHCVTLSHPYSARTIARAFMDNIYKLHWIPALITSDRDSVFLSRFWNELFSTQEVNLHYSTAYHPQTDCQTEVVNKCIEHYLRCMVGDCPNQWAKWLPLAEWWYNTNYHSATKMTPYEVLYGFPPPIHIPYFPKDSAVTLVDEYLNTKEEVIKRVWAHL
jgi:IS30 family transposase